ncbi:MAG: hypothetical protein A2Y38_15875 [Spirochaetes bacterium GWB1_59_5]|nr:MAG: hypothetical protein A2Y38_15875 [Spirochaetes bacterium GWB1_59_5]
MPITTAAGIADSTAAFITAAQNTATTAIADLELAAAAWTSVTWDALAPTALNTYTTLSDADATIKSALAAFDSALDLIAVPTIGDAPDLSSYTAAKWNDSAWTTHKALIAAFVSDITSADDLDTAVTKLTSDTTKLQNAMYAKDFERRSQVLRDLNSAADASTGAAGFSYPNSMTTALKLDAQQKFQFDMSQTARDLVTLMFNWAKDVGQFAIKEGTAVHNADVDFNIRYASVLIEVYDSTVKNALAEFRATFERKTTQFDQAVRSYVARADVIKLNNTASEVKDRVNAQNFGALVQQHATDVAQSVETAARNAKNKIDAAVAVVTGATNMVASASQISVGILTA